jgi:quinol monooxygenase YgiN
MITVIAHYTAAAAADAVRQLLARHAAAARAEPDYLQFDAHQGIDNPDEFALVERYEAQTAFAEHRRTPHSGATSRPNWSRCSPREAGRCSGQLCDATYDVLTPRSRDRSRRADMNA